MSAFAFFNLCEGENPPVYGFMENQNSDELIMMTKTFTEFLEKSYSGTKHVYYLENN